MKLSTNASSQRMRIVKALRIKPMTTPQMRTQLDIMEVAARIWELRHEIGYDIDKKMVEETSRLGVKHKVALYSLIHEPTQKEVTH